MHDGLPDGVSPQDNKLGWTMALAKLATLVESESNAAGSFHALDADMTAPTLLDRYTGTLLGLACGDALGTSVEFCPRGSFEPLTDIRGGGPFQLAPGQWTDDTSMALCLAESLLERGRFDPRDQMGRYLNWWRWGYLSSTGECFDIGVTTRSALQRFEASGDPYSGSTDSRQAGNGSLMRLAPVVLFFYPRSELVLQYAADSSRTTHAAPEAVDSCRLLAYALSQALSGSAKDQLLVGAVDHVTEPAVQSIAKGIYLTKERDAIRGSGYSVASLEAALWCIDRTGSFEEALLAAANLGEDADTTAAITGQLAGAFYGAQGIPPSWLSRLHMREEIEQFARRLHGSRI